MARIIALAGAEHLPEIALLGSWLVRLSLVRRVAHRCKQSAFQSFPPCADGFGHVQTRLRWLPHMERQPVGPRQSPCSSRRSFASMCNAPDQRQGVPTKTEQGDLWQVLGAGQGDYPRIVVAPTDQLDLISDDSELFNLCDKYHVPVWFCPIF